MNGLASGNDYALDLAIDSSGNIGVVGSVNRSDISQGDNIILRKYDQSGTTIWEKTYNSPGNDNDQAYHVAVDSSGSFIVGGFVTRNDLSQYTNWQVIKYGPDGTLLWTDTFNSPSLNSEDRVGGVAVDSSNSVYVSGEYYSSTVGDYFLTRKYSPSGTLLWSRTWSSPYQGGGWTSDTVIDSSGNITVVLSEVASLIGESMNIRLLRYDSGGNLFWTRTYNNPGNSFDHAWDTEVDADGNILVGGYEDRTDIGESSNCLLIKYAPEGTLLWSRTYARPGNSSDYISAIAVGQDGSITTLAFLANVAPIMMRYGSDGELHSKTAGYWDLRSQDSRGMAFDSSGNIFVSGYYYTDAATSFDWYIHKLSQRDACLSSSANTTVNKPILGEEFEVRLTVTNNGGSDATNVMPYLAVTLGSSRVVPRSGPNPAGPVTIPGGGTQVFTWTFSASITGWVIFSCSATGTDSLWGGRAWTSASVSQQLCLLPVLGASIVTEPSVNVQGNLLQVAFTVTNTGPGSVVSLTPALHMTSGDGLVECLGGPTPLSCTGISAGSAAAFSWSFSLTGAGMVDFTCSLSGTDPVTGRAVSVSAHGGLEVHGVATLVSSLSMESPYAVVGEDFRLFLTVTNTGSGDADLINPFLGFVCGSGSAAIVNGPSPAGPQTLISGGSCTFTWTCSASGIGAVQLTVTALGQDAASGVVIYAYDTKGITVLEPSKLESWISVVPPVAVPGMQVSILLTVSNTGGLIVGDIHPSCQVNRGAALASQLFSVTPAGSQTLAPHGTVAFSWTWSVSGEGTVEWTASAMGLEVPSGATLVSASTGELLVVNRSRLQASLSISRGPAKPGDRISVVMGVTNTGGSAVNSLTVAVWESAGGAIGELIGIVEPSSPVDLAPGGSVFFTWQYRVDGPGIVLLTATASGLEPISGCSVTAWCQGSVESRVPGGRFDHLLLDAPGAAIDRNSADFAAGDTVLVRIFPRGSGDISVKIYTVSGRLVTVLSQVSPMGEGQFLAKWDGSNMQGSRVARGVYILRVEAGSIRGILKILAK